MAGRPADITGERYGKLVAAPCHSGGADSHGYLWECKCDCGGSALVCVCDLRSGKKLSCGCVHGNSKIETLHPGAEDCFAYLGDHCDCLTEMLCRTRGKCAFYNKR